MRRWVQKLVTQFNFQWDENQPAGTEPSNHAPGLSLSEDRATLLFVIDVLNKHLIEVDRHPVRKVRGILDEFAKEMINPDRQNIEKLLFRFRQFFGSYRIDEYTYVQKTFDEFRGIIWDFVDQLSEDLNQEKKAERDVIASLDALKEAVEADSIVELKDQSREFIDTYIEHQTRREKRRSERVLSVKKNLDSVRQQLFEANKSMRLDHLTSAFNRKSFDEQVRSHVRISSVSPEPVSLLMLDIDHFKKINDSFGHAVGDFVLKECVRILHEVFTRSNDFVARIGGEEFAIILSGFTAEAANKKAEQLMERIRKDVIVHEHHKLQFTVSIGAAQLGAGEEGDNWIKRADHALYHSKNNGRNRCTVAPAYIFSTAA